jgi:hypothetical protein
MEELAPDALVEGAAGKVGKNEPAGCRLAEPEEGIYKEEAAVAGGSTEGAGEKT